MPRAAQQPTELELLILHVLWDESPLPVREVRQRLAAAGRDLAHTSVITMLNIMVRKGFLKRSSQGNAHYFAPKIEREKMSRRLVRGLVERVFGGSTAAVMHCLLDSAELTADELGEIRQLINRKTKEQP
jgi:BlaI family transcriptional regulator, penicillinase repressor